MRVLTVSFLMLCSNCVCEEHISRQTSVSHKQNRTTPSFSPAVKNTSSELSIDRIDKTSLHLHLGIGEQKLASKVHDSSGNTSVLCTLNEFRCWKSNPSKCIPKEHFCDRRKDCDNYEDEFYSEDCIKPCHPYNSTCDYFDTEFHAQQQVIRKRTCGIICPGWEEKCINAKSLCDGISDCENNEDEEICTTNSTVCPFNLFTCPDSHKCISMNLVCDGKDDCGNNQDEINCKTTFICTGSRKKLKWSRVCDGNRDCGDNSDERDCLLSNTNKCQTGMFVCKNSTQCVSKDLICNGYSDCEDGFDEMNCGGKLLEFTGTRPLQEFTNNKRECNSGYFLCPGQKNTKCVPEISLCDGNNDCGNFEDEVNCNYTRFPCEIGEVACPGLQKCISIRSICDRRNDCGNNEDESRCTRNSTSCPLHLYSCQKSNLCISSKLLCDGNNDCGNDEDEANCSAGDYHCKGKINEGFSSFTVIGGKQVCDGKNDCKGIDDEQNCFKNSTFCTQDKFSCQETDKCFSYKLVCDGTDDCGNGEDEMFCYAKLYEMIDLISPGLSELF